MAENRKELRVHFELEIKKGSAGNMLVVKFNPKARNVFEYFTLCPMLDELNVLNKAREAWMETK